MTNERITEDIVRSVFKNDPLFSKVKFEEQKSSNPRITKLLENASKKGLGVGRPEFIVSFSEPRLRDFLIVIECKASLQKHDSMTRDRYSDYAVDGVLLYSSYLSKEFNVLAIAVSGQEINELKVSHFIQHKSLEPQSVFGNELLSLESYIKYFVDSNYSKAIQLQNLLEYSKKLNEQLHLKKVKESQRGLLISGILIALQNEAFKNSYLHESIPKHLAKNLVTTISNELIKAKLQQDKISNMELAFSFITVHTSLSEEYDVLKDFISDINSEILDFIKNNHYYDVLGQFYIEFLRYANSDKGLGIVLTPPHITSLLCDLTYVNKDSVVIDNCTGTGGFLISAMDKMVDDAKGDQHKIKEIKSNQLVGIEYQEDIFALAVSNMFIHGDGKSNIFSGSCFDNEIILSIKSKFKPTIGLLNPPYKTQSNDYEELEFVFNNLNLIQKGGYCAAIIPISILLASSGNRLELKHKLMKYHTVEAVLSMPDELFLNSHASVITCVIVIKAHVPHSKIKETYFGYWKNDGFVRVKYKGRVNKGNWDHIKEVWLDSYINKKNIPGISVMKHVSPEDEWCAEAYMETDYSLLTRLSFVNTVHRFATHQFFSGNRDVVNKNKVEEIELDLDIMNWRSFTVGDIFTVQRGKEKALDTDIGAFPLVMATRENNGVSSYIEDGKFLFSPGAITVVGNGASTGESFYQPTNFYAGSDVCVLYPKSKISKYALFFIITVLKLESYRFSYGRKWSKSRLENHSILLPDLDGVIDIAYMDLFIKSLEYSENI